MFDIDHLYLASLNYKVEDNGNVSIIKDGESKERYQNDLLYCMLTLLKDTDNSINSLYKSIDNDTELPKSIADQIPETSSNKAKAYNFGTLHEQAERRLDYVTGKNGIGPFALNVTNHVLTCLFGVKFRETKFTEQTGIFNFDKLVDDDGNMISSWLSAFINAHVDIVKDPWISKMGVDPFTYNMVNLLIRSGFGEAGMWFIAQPIIKDMANASSTASSQFTRDTFKYKSVYAAQKDAVANAVMAYLDEDDVKESKLETYIGSNPSSEQVGARIDVVNYIKTHQKLLKEIAINPGKKTVIVDGKEYNVKEVQKTIFYAWKTLEKYSIALSTLVQYTKIDTCKQGKTFIEMYRYLDMYDRLLNNDKSLWDRESIKNLAMKSWIESKTRDTCTFPFDVLSTQLFNANENFIQRLVLPICNALKNADDPLNVDMMNEVSQSLQTSIKSKYIIDYAHHQLGMTDQDISNLFVGPRSMNHRFNMLWNAIRTNPKYSYLANNQLLTHLYSVNEESEVWVNGRQYERPSFLSISDSIEDSRLNSDLMIDGWEDLLRDSDVNVKNFAKDLIIYAFLTSGEYKGWNRLFKFVPPAWVRGEIGSFEKVGSFSDYIRNILSGNTLSSVQYQPYLDEIIANHFSDNRFSTRMSLKDKDGNNNFITCGDIIAIGAGKEHEIFPQYITVKKSGRSGKNTSDYTTYRFSYSFSTKENPKIFYPVYARAKRKGYQSMDGKFNIYEYGWHFNYVENESDAFSTFDYDEALMKVAVYLSQHPITQNQINNATNISILSDIISKVYLGYVPDQVEDNNNQADSVSQELQTVTNVYAGTSENVNLSNFALRPFETRIGKFDTVEGAFQAAKIYYTNGTKYLTRDDKGKPTGLTEEGKSVIRRLMTASGSEARSIGRNISDLNTKVWDENSTNFLEDFMRRSFEQNPQARKELTNTGNSTITHKNKQGVEQDNGRFSSILTKIRDEFKSLLPNPNSNKIEQHIGDWSRTEVEQHPNYLYIFTDNTDRDSGSQLIDPNSKYARKYGQNKHYPKMTQAVIRGLDNAMPLSTQRWYHGDKKGKTGVWTDANIEEFKKVIDQEIDDIIREWDTGKYEKLIIGDGDAFFNSNISNISITRAPKLYQYLKQKVQELYKYIDENDTNQGSLNQNDTDQFGTPSEQASTLNSDKTIHNTDRMLNYYNEDGTLKQNRFTDSGLNKPVTKKIDALSISDKTETFGVHIDPNIVRNYKTWLDNNKDGIVAYRMHKDRFNTKQNVEEGIIGNPFDWRKYGTEKCLQMFADWLMTGNNFGESLANDEYRSAIINKLLSIDKPNILYYKELNKPSHATILGYLIEHKELLQSTTQFTKTKKMPKNYQEYIDVIQKYFDIGYTTGRIGKNAANQVIQKLHIHVDEDSDLFDAIKKNNLSERDLLNALYVLASYLNRPEIKGRTTLSSQQINEIQSKLNTEMIPSDILGMTGGYYHIKESTNDSLIVDTQLMSDIDFLLQNKKYEPIYQQLLDYAMNDKYINEYYEDIVDIFNVDHEDFSDLIHVYSTFDNVNQLELFSEEDMKKAKEIKNHCKGGN